MPKIRVDEHALTALCELLAKQCHKRLPMNKLPCFDQGRSEFVWCKHRAPDKCEELMLKALKRGKGAAGE